MMCDTKENFKEQPSPQLGDGCSYTIKNQR